MSFCKFCKDLTTGKDNQTHDIVRVAIMATTCALIASFLLGTITYVYGYFYSLQHPDAKPFDIQTYFNATSTMAVAISAFLMGGASSLFFKRTTEPDGTETTVSSVKSGAGSTEPEVQVTRVTNTTNIAG